MSYATNMSTRIDTHAHFVPPFYRQALLDTGNEHPDGMPAIPPWNETSQLSMMDSLNIQRSILSITSPGTNLVHSNSTTATTISPSARNLTRATNEYAAKLKRQHPSRLGFWASVPLPDVEGALLELSYSLDVLNADGIALLTNYHGYYLGDPLFRPLFEELNRRGVTVFVHPTVGCTHIAQGYTPAAPLPQYSFPVFEFMFDTARAIINLFYSGTFFKYPNITYIFSHCGGALPPIVQRFASVPALLPSDVYDPAVTPETVKEFLSGDQIYFDLAGWSFPDQVKELTGLGVSAKQLLYGSDWCFTPLKVVMDLSKQIEEGLRGLFGVRERELVWEGNARRLLAKGKKL